LSIFGVVPSPSNKSIERIPIEPAKIGQRSLRTGHLSLGRQQHDAPVRGSKVAGSIVRQALVWFHLSHLRLNLHGNLVLGNADLRGPDAPPAMLPDPTAQGLRKNNKIVRGTNRETSAL
jgi:hypothetical protein